MSSFYGGHQGRNFIISKTFKSVAEMLKAFQNPSSTTVKFDEYVLIKTEDKSNPENGLLFRRGYDYNNYSKDTVVSWSPNKTIDEESTVRGPYIGENVPACGAELVGNLVGPIGKAPLMKLMTMEEAQEIGTQYQLEDPNLYDYTTGMGAYGLSYKKVETPRVDAETGEPILDEETGEPIIDITYEVDNVNGNIVPGKYESDSPNEEGIVENVYNDAIKWYYCTVRDANGVEGTAYLGFQFPYLVIDYDAFTVSPYYHRDSEKINFQNLNLVDRDDDMSHPYYEKWSIKIPKGIKGDSLTNFRVETITNQHVEEGTFVKFPGNNDENGQVLMDENGDILFEQIDYNDHPVGSQIFVCDYYHYDRFGNGEKFTFCLGAYNVLGDKTAEGKTPIEFTDDGTIIIRYTHDEDVSYPQEINYLTDFQINNDGTVKVKMNNRNIVDENYNSEEFNILKEKFITLLKTFTFNQETGQVLVTFNNDNIDPVDVTLNHIKKVALDPSNNHLLFYHSDPDVRTALTNKATFDGKNDWQDMGGFGYAAFDAEEPDATNIAYSGLWFKLEDR